MPKTYPRITFGLYGLSIKKDATIDFDDHFEWSKAEDIITGNVGTKPLATFEPNFWLLDGNYKIPPVDNSVIHAGILSDKLTGGDGLFASPIFLTVNFGAVHSSNGLTLRFAAASNDYANAIEVTYYDDVDDVIRTDAYSPTSWEFSTEQAVNNFKSITIKFIGTNKPFRRLRLTGIDFGTLIYFERGEVRSASVVQEINPISTELPIDTLELTVISNDAEFSIVNPAGNYAALQTRQPLDVYEFVNDAPTYLGKFYLRTWDAVSEKVTKFVAQDAIGILDAEEYLGGMFVNEDSDALIESILSSANIPYELDPALYNIPITGWIPVCTCREALRQIAFAIGAVVTSSNAGLLRIFPVTLASEYEEHDQTLTKAKKGSSQSLGLKPIVTGVEITAHSFTEEEPQYADGGDTTINEKTVFRGALSVGTHTIKLKDPTHSAYIFAGSNAIIDSYGANYVVVTKSVSAGDIEIRGFGYIDGKRTFSVYTEGLDESVPANILKVQDATLVNPANAQQVTQRVYDYHQQRYVQKVKLYVPEIVIASSVKVDTHANKQIGGVAEKMEFNLTDGFTAQAKIVGVVLP